MATTGSVIRAGRELLGYSVQRFADAIGVSRGAVQQWENSTTAPKRALQPVVARLLGITVADLMDPPRHLRDEEVKDWLAARQRSSDPRVIDVQAREVPQPGERAALPSSGQSSGAPPVAALDTVRAEVQAVPPELRDVLARLVTEYITAPESLCGHQKAQHDAARANDGHDGARRLAMRSSALS